MKKILLVDDDKKYLEFLKEVLTLENYQVTAVDNAMLGIELFKKNIFDLVISDLKMESVDGLQFLYMLRKIEENSKVILLTSSDSDADEMKGLEFDVTDYVRKKTSIKILLKRVERAVEQTNSFKKNQISCAKENIEVDCSARKVKKNGQEIKLTLKEYEMLVLFLKNRNVVLEREKIIKAIWRIETDYIDVRVVDTHVKSLRKKLQVSCIFSIRGVGYEWSE